MEQFDLACKYLLSKGITKPTIGIVLGTGLNQLLNYVDDKVTILSHQDSGMLNSFALANALVYVLDGNYQLLKGDKVCVYRI